MICNDVREHIFAFLDNELDATRSIELQQHLDRCAACAQEAEIERTIRKRLEAALVPRNGFVPAIETSFVMKLGAEARRPGMQPARRRGRPRARRAAGIAVMAVIAGVIGASVLLWRSSVPSTPLLPTLLAEDFAHFLEKGRPLQIASADRAEVTDWLRQKTGVEAALPEASAEGWHLRGGRKCTIDGEKAAFAIFESDEGIASLVALPQPHDALADLEVLERDGRSYRLSRRAGYNVVACRRGDLVYAAVSTLPVEKLLALIPPPARETEMEQSGS